jgi:hypothetical protein
MVRTRATYWAWAAAGLRLCADPAGRGNTPTAHGTRHAVAGNEMHTLSGATFSYVASQPSIPSLGQE